MKAHIVYRISLWSLASVYRAVCRLCTLLQGDCRRSVEMEETTCILRIETEHLTQAQLYELMTLTGFDCKGNLTSRFDPGLPTGEA